MPFLWSQWTLVLLAHILIFEAIFDHVQSTSRLFPAPRPRQKRKVKEITNNLEMLDALSSAANGNQESSRAQGSQASGSYWKSSFCCWASLHFLTCRSCYYDRADYFATDGMGGNEYTMLIHFYLLRRSIQLRLMYKFQIMISNFLHKLYISITKLSNVKVWKLECLGRHLHYLRI